MTSVNSLISLSIEIEGLLRVLQNRDTVETRHLLCEKFTAYTDLMHSLLEVPAEVAIPENFSFQLETEIFLPEKVEEEDEEEVEEVEATEATEAAEEAEEAEEAEAAEEAPISPITPITSITPIPEEEEEDTFSAPIVVPTAPHEHAGPVRNTVATAFRLNDKFYFMNDVFDGNEADFNDTVALIADMDSYEEAYDYLVNDMMLDPKQQPVADFLEIIKANISI